ncbi:WhiB family transcriptional regulator [Natronosporangium hydrolyticum]|uniref:Transcriptional regulator WhiB n=1 Tax=Natronosporangium hydrolyticum TaxID=2811111 RepID=A0A895YNJ2_9ACTN|nr:WhiB family transcriptional regulator [Natronosporangium hydrolyticum]
MTRARTPRPHEVDEARRDERLLRALREGGRDPAWRTRGACQHVDPETFFPAPSEPADAAVAMCRPCPVQGACLAWALQAGDLHGVWGGTTARERRAMAVVWHSEEQGSPAPELPANQPVVATAAAAGPVLAESVGRRPHAATTDTAGLPGLPVGASMDRAELLRLVNAG